jgi:uncharacterized alpha-E superfamily protein
VERVEAILRLLRAYHVRLAETANPNAPLCRSLHAHLSSFGAAPHEPIPAGLLSTLESVVQSASHVRDLFSVDGWLALHDLDKSARRFAKKRMGADDAARAVSVLLRKVSGFSGLVHENMYHFTGWRFLRVGRALERASLTIQTLERLAESPTDHASLDLAVELCDSVMTHRRRYVVATTRETVIDLLALDGQNPRSVRFQVDAIREHSEALPGVEEDGDLSDFAHAGERLHARLMLATVTDLTGDALRALRSDLGHLSELLTAAYLR